MCHSRLTHSCLHWGHGSLKGFFSWTLLVWRNKLWFIFVLYPHWLHEKFVLSPCVNFRWSLKEFFFNILLQMWHWTVSLLVLWSSGILHWTVSKCLSIFFTEMPHHEQVFGGPWTHFKWFGRWSVRKILPHFGHATRGGFFLGYKSSPGFSKCIFTCFKRRTCDWNLTEQYWQSRGLVLWLLQCFL